MNDLIASFLDPLDVRLEDDGTYTTLEPFRFYSKVTGKEYTVPKGFNTDFASVPRIPFAYWIAGGRYAKAATGHDFLYRTGAEPRDICDKIFLELMEVMDRVVKRETDMRFKFLRGLMYSGVRAGGRRHHLDTSPKPEQIPAAHEDAKTFTAPLGD